MGAYGAIIIILVWYRLAETLPSRDLEGLRLRRLRRNYQTLLTDRRFLVITACTCCMHGAMFAWLSGAVLVFVESYGATASLTGLFISISLAGFILGSAIAGRISIRLGGARLITTGNIICLASTAFALVLAVGATPAAPIMIAPTFVFMFGIGFVIPPGSAAAVAPFPTMAGAASSLVGFSQIGTSSTVILISGYLYDGTMVPVMLVMTCLAGGGLLIFALGNNRTMRH